MPAREAISAGRAVRRAAGCAAAACLALWVGLLTARLTAPTGGASPWDGGPLSLVGHLGLLVLPLVLGPTLIRVLAHPRAVPMPPSAIRTAIAGVIGTVGCLAIVLLAALAARLSAVGTPDAVGSAGWLPALPVLVAGGAAAAAAQAARQARVGFDRFATRTAGAPDAGRPDLLDDLATLVARALPGSLPARTGAWLNRGLDDWAWSPRRHRTGFVIATAGPTGIAISAWYVAARPWSDLVTPVVLAAFSAALVAAGLAAAITWLGLLRPQPE